jgi:pheromone shutdown protein TraB
MASVLRDSPGHRIVGVFGLGHIDGIAQHLKDDDVDGKALRKQLTTIPPHTFYSSIVSQTLFSFKYFSEFEKNFNHLLKPKVAL